MDFSLYNTLSYCEIPILTQDLAAMICFMYDAKVAKDVATKKKETHGPPRPKGAYKDVQGMHKLHFFFPYF